MDSFTVLTSIVDLHQLDGEPGSTWESIYCSSKAAYGCGKHGQKLVEGLKLYVRRVEKPDLRTCISIRLSDEASRSIEAELRVPRGVLEAKGNVKIAHRGLLVLIVNFLVRQHSSRIYFLVYDTADASLCMVPDLPSDLVAYHTRTPVPRRLPGGGVELVLVVGEYWSQAVEQEYLCLCSTAATRAANSSASSSGINGMWETKEKRSPEPHAGIVSADAVFSLGGKVFWADLSRGLAYCDDPRAGNSAVEFNFIALPRGYEIRPGKGDEFTVVPKMSRTIGCTEGGSIRFVCIDRSRSRGRVGDAMVKVWTLDLARRKWKAELGVLWKDLWNEIDFMEAEMWDVEPLYPVLMPDGALCVLLNRPGKKGADHICGFDLGRQTPLWHGRFPDHHAMGRFILPGNFFKKCRPPPPPLERYLPARKRKMPELQRGDDDIQSRLMMHGGTVR